jgi:undecaprenyl-diphosphatase
VDARIAVWVSTHRIGAMNELFAGLGTANKLGLLWVVTAIAIGLRRGSGIVGALALAIAVAITAFAADSASFGVKDLVARARPFEAHPQIHPLYVVHSSSFPAGHAATAFAGATVLAYVVPRAAPLLFLVAALIGFSRVYVGVHYPTDVLGGAAIGVAVGAVVVLALRAARDRGFRRVDRHSIDTAGTSEGAPNVFP